MGKYNIFSKLSRSLDIITRFERGEDVSQEVKEQPGEWITLSISEHERLLALEGEIWNLRRLNGTYKQDMVNLESDVERYRTERDRYKEALEEISRITVLESADSKDMKRIAEYALKGADTQ